MSAKVSLLGLLALAISSCQSTRLVLESSQIKELTKCPITLDEARMNLLRRGYSIIAHGDDFFSTDFKKSDFETVSGLITGETLKEYYRRFVVYSLDHESIDYRFQYQVYRLGEPVVRLANPRFTYDKLSKYQKIRGEVCGSLDPRTRRRKKKSTVILN